MAWWSDLRWQGRSVRVVITGQRIPLTPEVWHEVTLGFLLFLIVYPCGLWRRWRAGPRPRLGFMPQQALPWHLIWNAAWVAGLRLSRPSRANVIVAFEDTAHSPAPQTDTPLINARATDVRKSTVTAVADQVFALPLAVDPTTHSGPVVEKGEANGLHDGRVCQAPCPAQPDKSYQRLVENQIGDEVVDLRTPCVDGIPICVFVKRRPLASRFANHNSRCDLLQPLEVFRPEEIEAIKDFNDKMGLEWGGLDILRDRTSGEITVVDSNKTDMGPPLVLPLHQRLDACQQLGQALTQLIFQKAGPPP